MRNNNSRQSRCLDGLCQKNRNERREKENENDKTVHQKYLKVGGRNILKLDTKPFVISTDELFQVDAYF